MTDLEKFELAIRRTAERLNRFANKEADYAAASAMEALADQINDDERERARAAHKE